MADTDGFLPDGLNDSLLTRSAVASTFAASLELVKGLYRTEAKRHVRSFSSVLRNIEMSNEERLVDASTEDVKLPKNEYIYGCGS